MMEIMSVDFEKLGLFYLGKRYDLTSGARQREPTSTTRRTWSPMPCVSG
jgi:hypothetical protein